MLKKTGNIPLWLNLNLFPFKIPKENLCKAITQGLFPKSIVILKPQEHKKLFFS